MQLTYWKKFDKVFKHFSGKKIYEEILKLVDLLGEPYKKKSNKGRKFKITPKEYTAIIAFKISSRDNFRDMELDSELYVDEHIDHSTFGKNFFKIPYDYLRKLLKLTGNLLEGLLGRTKVHVADSTKITTDRYRDIVFQGKPRRVKGVYKLHTMIQRHPEKQMTIIVDGIATDEHISDSEGAVRMMTILKEGDKFTADRGYDYEKVYKTCYTSRITTNIKPQKRSCGKHSVYRKKMVKSFDETRYKKERGIVETEFAGFENKGLVFTHYRTNDARLKYGLILETRHNINNLLKLKVERITIISYCSTNFVFECLG